jgi:hypothetical protein
LVPPGTYTATAADADRNCTSSSPSSVSVNITSGGTTNQNFTMAGTSNLEENHVTIDDSLANSGGNGNGVINRFECVNLNIELKNNGCADATASSATLTTTTPDVTVVQGNSNYPSMVIDTTGTNATPFKIQTANSFACGTEIELDLNLTFPNGSKTIHITVPTCTGGINGTLPSSTLTSSDSPQADRLGRDGTPSGCAGKACPGGIGTPGTRFFKTFGPFTNSAGVPACITVTINAATGVPNTGDIESAAYLGTYDPTNLCLNYLGDSGISGLGTTVGSASYSFTVPAGANFVVVVNTTGTTDSTQFSGTVSGFFDNTAGPGPCAQ